MVLHGNTTRHRMNGLVLYHLADTAAVGTSILVHEDAHLVQVDHLADVGRNNAWVEEQRK